jgi:hypothetical protein
LSRIPLSASEGVAGVEELGETQLVVASHREEGCRLHIDHRAALGDAPADTRAGLSKDGVGGPGSPNAEREPRRSQFLTENVHAEGQSVNDPRRGEVVGARSLIT